MSILWIIILIITLSGLTLSNLIDLLLNWVEKNQNLKIKAFTISDIIEIIIKIITIFTICYIYF